MDKLSGPPLEPPFGFHDSPIRHCLAHDPNAEQSPHQRPFPQAICALQSEASLVLPAVYHDKSHSLQSIDENDEASIQKFLEWELKVPRLNEIHEHLWLAGRPASARPLHRQAMLGRDIAITEQVDLHMVRQESRMFLKPMPDFILDDAFWKDHICKDFELYECARGFLLSYIWLVCSKSDLRMAQNKGLLAPNVSWERWKGFTKSLLCTINFESLEGVNRRYHYGELRLSRLNWIYRLSSRNRGLTTLVRGYMYGYNRYSDIVQRNFAWVLVAFVYITIVLTAMQVGLATDRLGNSDMFQNASYGFTVFSIITPLIVIVVIILNLFCLSAFNVLATLSFKKKMDGDRRILLEHNNSGTP
ncbi:hypothetical protein OEA41_003728 [Lepraria neglecta]|uniref:Uncharacterized protein n=1 Tax=Lepraria neglecta TaxID=209136 RepID=A0AAD9Z4T3_9LECA|nr:hypothetical protein OEA41_003728 [Lepraria neglecta]